MSYRSAHHKHISRTAVRARRAEFTPADVDNLYSCIELWKSENPKETTINFDQINQMMKVNYNCEKFTPVNLATKVSNDRSRENRAKKTYNQVRDEAFDFAAERVSDKSRLAQQSDLVLLANEQSSKQTLLKDFLKSPMNSSRIESRLSSQQSQPNKSNTPPAPTPTSTPTVPTPNAIISEPRWGNYQQITWCWFEKWIYFFVGPSSSYTVKFALIKHLEYSEAIFQFESLAQPLDLWSQIPLPPRVKSSIGKQIPKGPNSNWEVRIQTPLTETSFAKQQYRYPCELFITSPLAAGEDVSIVSSICSIDLSGEPPLGRKIQTSVSSAEFQ